MSDTNNRNDQYEAGTVRGDDKAMPNRGTGTNVTDTYGVDLSPGAKNGMGKITGATKSDAPLDNDAGDELTI